MNERHPISRRRMLGMSGGAMGAAITAPALIPATALGKNGARAPSERITMGFIGVGLQGGGHLLGGAWTYVTGGYAGRQDVQVVAVCDVWRQRRESARQRVDQHYAEIHGKGARRSCEAYVDFRYVLDRSDIDAVLIATPAHWHATMAVMAAQAGKDIYCEKPTAVTVRESQAVQAAVRRYSRVFQAGTQQRSEYAGVFRRACEFVRSGRIGRLLEVYACREGGGIAWPERFGPAMPIPEDLDWDLYLGPAPDLPYDANTSPHRFDIGELNWGQHHYDIVQWAAGADETGPVELFLHEGRTAYRYASGVTVYGMPHPAETVGLDGGAVFVGTEGRIAVDRSTMVATPADIIREPLRPSETHLYRTEGHSANFLDCVRTRQRPISDVDTAHRAVSALLLGGVVKQLQRPLEWHPQREEFPGDEEANRMLSYAKRAPWRT